MNSPRLSVKMDSNPFFFLKFVAYLGVVLAPMFLCAKDVAPFSQVGFGWWLALPFAVAFLVAHFTPPASQTLPVGPADDYSAETGKVAKMNQDLVTNPAYSYLDCNVFHRE